MASMIVAIILMRKCVIMIALRTNLSAKVQEDVSLVPGNVTGIRTVQMVLMRLMMFAIIGNVTLSMNSPAKMENVFQSYGAVILIMIVVMTVMSLHTFAEIRIVPVVGVDVLDMPITGVFRNGCSVMGRTTAETALTN